ncbi:hypothetical protein [Tenuifilum osseticum]|uniref:hypothetical protein n=1 Tax=Tenuifilum TaxID=2760873 RepID=UPI00309D94E0
MIWSIATQTGWSFDHILWGISWATLQLMMADAPRYITKRKNKDLVTLDDARKFLKL